MKKLLGILFLSFLTITNVFAGDCPEWSWKTNYDNTKATFEFKSTINKTFKLTEIILYNKKNQRTLVKNFSDSVFPVIINPYGIKEYVMYIGDLNPEMINSARTKCISYIKGNGKRTYTSTSHYIVWEKSNNNFFTECDKILKVICDGWNGVNRNKNEYGFKLGERMGIYDKNGKAITSFQVNQVIIDHNLNLCWLSEKKTVKLKDYLLLKKCYLYK